MADVADYFFDVLFRDAGYGGHVSEGPVVLGDAIGYGVADAEVGVMAGVVDTVNEWRAEGGTDGALAMTRGTVGVEQFLALAGSFRYFRKCSRGRLGIFGFGSA